jgi:hypothetical protein
MINSKIEFTKEQLINVINNSGLPIGIIHYLLKDISNEVIVEYNRAIAQERQQQIEQMQKEEQGEEDGKIQD